MWLRQLRDELGLTQAELAEAMGWSQQLISDVECGLKGLSKTRILELRDAHKRDLLRLGITLEEMMG